MNLFADESVEKEVVQRLRALWHTVEYVAELSPSITDEEVLTAASTRGTILLTSDKDFGELVFRRGQIHAGVILMRLGDMKSEAKANAIESLMTAHEQDLPGSFCVVAPGSVRIRRLQLFEP